MTSDECVALVRQAVEWQDAHLGAIRAGECETCGGYGVVCVDCGREMFNCECSGLSEAVTCPKCDGSGKARPTRLPDARWRSWYERARAALDAIE